MRPGHNPDYRSTDPAYPASSKIFRIISITKYFKKYFESTFEIFRNYFQNISNLKSFEIYFKIFQNILQYAKSFERFCSNARSFERFWYINLLMYTIYTIYI